MDQDRWWAWEEPEAMLTFLETWGARLTWEPDTGWLTQRKVRLFACACCRLNWHLLTDERSRRAVEMAERYALGQATWADLVPYNGVADIMQMHRWDTLPESTHDLDQRWSALVWVSIATSKDPLDGRNGGDACTGIRGNSRVLEATVPAARQADLIREIVGDPYDRHSVPPAVRSWQDGTIPALVRSIYETRDFGRTLILADACEEAGLDPEGAVVKHLRGYERCQWCRNGKHTVAQVAVSSLELDYAVDALLPLSHGDIVKADAEGRAVRCAPDDPEAIGTVLRLSPCPQCHGREWYPRRQPCVVGCWAADALAGL